MQSILELKDNLSSIKHLNFSVMVSLADRINKVDDENTELNLDGLQKPDLSLLSEKADVITG